MRSMWRFLKLGTIGLFGLMMLVAVSNSGCKQEDEVAESVLQEPETDIVEVSAEVPKETGEQGGDKIDLKILYAGHPGSQREEALVTFLREHFAAVQTCDLEGFKEDQAEGFAVTVMDYDGDAFKAPRPRLSRDFSRPVMTVGVVGAFICGNLNLKMGYL
jgi:hypothetical protein